MTRAIRRSGPILLGLFALALILRMVEVDWHGFHPDEAPGTSARMLTGQLTGFALYYPPLLNYLVAIAYAGLYALGRLLGWWHSAAGFRDLYFTDRTLFYLVARAVAAACSACAPPLLFALTRTLNVSRRWALAAGGVAALIPGEIFWSHVEKSDVALASAYLLVTLAAFRLLDRPDRLGRRLLMGFALALAVSFKQSAVFFLLPFMGLVLLASLADPVRRGRMLLGWAVVLGAAALCWAVLNVGILLDLQGFLAAQRTQSQMSLRHASVAAALGAWWEAMTSGDAGMAPALLVASPVLLVGAVLLAPDRTAARRLAAALVSLLLAMAAIVAIAGDRQPHHLLLPFATLLQLLMLAGAGLVARRPGWGVAAGAVMLAVAALAIVRLLPIYRQFGANPIADKAAASVAAHVPSGSRIVSITALPALPQSPLGAEEVRQRDERLAARYGLALPPGATPEGGDPAGYVVRPFPFAIGGMEFMPENARILVPYAWPIQQAEWRLPYWRERGYRYFLIDPWFLAPDGIPAYRNLFSTIVRQCRQLDRLRTDRPLLWERDLLLYDCG